MKKLTEITPESLACLIGASCPAIFKTNERTYILIGKKIDAEKLGLSGRIGEGEIAIEVPRELIDEKQSS